MKKLSALILFCGLSGSAFATLIPAERLTDWTPGVYTGVVGGIPTNYTEHVKAVYSGVDNTGATDASVALNALIVSCPSGEYVFLPAGDYKCLYTLNMKSGVVLRGAGNTTHLINHSGSRCIQMGPTNGFVFPEGSSPGDMTVSAGLAKGSTTLTIGSAATLSVGQLVRLREDIDDDVPHVSVFLFRYITQQVVRITSKTSNTITFFPPLYDSYGGGAIAADVSAPHEQIEGSGVENMLLDLTADGQTGIGMNQAYGCWVKGVTGHEVRNYPVSIEDSLQCEVRRCISQPRNGSGTSGAGIIVARSSGLLIEDNIIYDNWICELMINDGTSGCLISRNFSTGPHFVDTNHAPHNQFNLYEGNVNSGFKSDGYFGGERYLTIFRNKCRFASLYRFTRDSNLIGNIYSGATQSGANANRHGYPNFGNDLFEGGATWYSGHHADDWRDRVVTGTITAIEKGTGTGYLVNHSPNYTVGTTSIAVDTGTGTILAGDVVSFGTSHRYQVVSFSAGVITIATNNFGTIGLITEVADNAPVTVSSDKATVSTVGGGFRANGSFGAMYIMLVWNSYGVYQQYRVDTVDGADITIIPTNPDGIPNQTPVPVVGTSLKIGMGQDLTVFQEKDLGVEATLIQKGNRYMDGAFDSLGGDTLPNSLAYTAKPQWILDAETELSTTFPWPGFDPVTPTPAGDSDIPAGYRYTFTLEPTVTGASINPAGNVLSIGANKPMFVGSGGAVNATLSGGVVCTFSSIVGSTLLFTPARTIVEGETLTVAITNVTNGFEDVNGNDLPSFSGLAVTNSSSATTGVLHFGPDVSETNADAPYGDSSFTIIQPADVTSAGTALGVRFYVAGNTFNAPARVTICDAANTILGSGLGTVTGVDRWMFIPVTSFHLGVGEYRATMQFLGGGDPTLRGIGGQPSGSGYLHEGTPWFSPLPAQFTPVSPTTNKFALQIRVAADEETGTTNPAFGLRRQVIGRRR